MSLIKYFGDLFIYIPTKILNIQEEPLIIGFMALEIYVVAISITLLVRCVLWA